MNDFIFNPVVLVAILFVFCALFSYGLNYFSFDKKGVKSSGEAYACGEEHYDIYAQPDYSQFFPFAFFFTIAHVATLVLATIPFVNISIFVAAVLYLSAVFVGLFILLWRQ